MHGCTGVIQCMCAPCIPVCVRMCICLCVHVKTRGKPYLLSLDAILGTWKSLGVPPQTMASLPCTTAEVHPKIPSPRENIGVLEFTNSLGWLAIKLHDAPVSVSVAIINTHLTF